MITSTSQSTGRLTQSTVGHKHTHTADECESFCAQAFDTSERKNKQTRDQCVCENQLARTKSRQLFIKHTNKQPTDKNIDSSSSSSTQSAHSALASERKKSARAEWRQKSSRLKQQQHQQSIQRAHTDNNSTRFSPHTQLLLFAAFFCVCVCR